MRKYYCSENGYVEHERWVPHCWVDVECPDREDLGFMLDDLGIPSSFLTSISDNDERPRIEHEGDWSLTIIRIPMRDTVGDVPFITVPLGIVSNNEVMLTLCYHYTELLPDFINHTRCKGIEITETSDFILRIIHSASYWYLTYLKEINHTVQEGEKKLRKAIRNEDLLGLMKLQNTLVYFNTAIRGDESLFGKIRHVYQKSYDTDLMEDVEIEMQQAENTVDVYNDILESIMDSYASVISNTVNAIMKKMTAVSVVLMVPTLVASFYGMNVEISYGNHWWVFFAISGGSMLTAVLLYFIRRRANWF